MIRKAFDWMAHSRRSLLAGLLIFAVLVAFGWVGFLGSDDVTYALGAYGWIEEFPFVGGHGTIRYPITIPMALSFVTFGHNEFAMVLPSLIYMIAAMGISWLAVRRAGGSFAAAGALAALVTSPLLVIQSSIASVDIVEMTFLWGSVLLFWRCLEEGPDAKRLAGAGALAGLAFITRETAIFIAVFYALFFLKGHRFHRGHYLWITAGFLGVWACEVLYLWIMTGDPFYRITISLNHDSTIDRSIDLAGNVVIHPIIDPLLVLFLNQEFMALFFLAVPLGSWLCFSNSIEPKLKHFAQVTALFGIVWLVCTGAAQSLLPLNPRYFMIPCLAACILTGITLAQLIAAGGGRAKFATLGFAGLIATNLLGITVENKDSLFGERTLARIAAQYPQEAIHSDPMTRYRADMLLRWEGARGRVKDTPTVAGQLYIYNPAHADAANFKMDAAALPAYQPRETDMVIARYAPAPSLLARLLETSGIAYHLPQSIWLKLRYRHPHVTLYRSRGSERP